MLRQLLYQISQVIKSIQSDVMDVFRTPKNPLSPLPKWYSTTLLVFTISYYSSPIGLTHSLEGIFVLVCIYIILKITQNNSK